ncbi:hypothetical protein MTR_1g040050 [Medicago truncatula]|uniref:Uncharacterized protein n=1 Tax=Medicago truncatula TaxID=3880 RepID=G7IDF1_MEDTR|nr:hypothetical protein MTR_1g040050 [Medicago truncatula]
MTNNVAWIRSYKWYKKLKISMPPRVQVHDLESELCWRRAGLWNFYSAACFTSHSRTGTEIFSSLLELHNKVGTDICIRDDQGNFVHQATKMASPPQKSNLISCGPLVHISDIKLIRTDTTLDLSQKAEKGMISMKDQLLLLYQTSSQLFS